MNLKPSWWQIAKWVNLLNNKNLFTPAFRFSAVFFNNIPRDKVLVSGEGKQSDKVMTITKILKT